MSDEPQSVIAIYRVHEALFRLRAEAGRPTEAVDVMERAKGENLLDAFVKSTSEGTAPTEGFLSSGITPTGCLNP